MEGRTPFTLREQRITDWDNLWDVAVEWKEVESAVDFSVPMALLVLPAATHVHLKHSLGNNIT